MFWGAGTAAHVGDGPLQELSEQGLFFRGKAFHDPLFILLNDPVDQRVAFPALVQHMDPLAPVVLAA